MMGEHEKSLKNHEPEASDLQPFCCFPNITQNQ